MYLVYWLLELNPTYRLSLLSNRTKLSSPYQQKFEVKPSINSYIDDFNRNNSYSNENITMNKDNVMMKIDCTISTISMKTKKQSKLKKIFIKSSEFIIKVNDVSMN